MKIFNYEIKFQKVIEPKWIEYYEDTFQYGLKPNEYWNKRLNQYNEIDKLVRDLHKKNCGVLGSVITNPTKCNLTSAKLIKEYLKDEIEVKIICQ